MQPTLTLASIVNLLQVIEDETEIVAVDGCIIDNSMTCCEHGYWPR